MATQGRRRLQGALRQGPRDDEESATAAWVKALAANGPLLTDADEAAAEAVGAPDQTEPFVGLMSSAKFRDNADAGMKLGLCTGLKPWPGWMYPSLGLIAKGTDSPNAAKLFIHYLMTEEGIAPQAVDGKMSTNTDGEAAGGRALGHRQGSRPVFAYDRRDRWRRLGRPAGLAGSLAGQLRKVIGSPGKARAEETRMQTQCMGAGGASVAALLAAALLAGPAAAEEAFDLDALVEAAKAEPPITVYDSTGKIVEMAEDFTKKYGVQATGEKVSATSQLEMVIREAQAKNVLGDVVLITDAPAGLAQLLPQEFVES